MVDLNGNKPQSGDLKIVYGERQLGDRAGAEAVSLSLKLPWYRFRGKIGGSHSFLQLQDADGNVVQQIHGAALSVRQGQLAPTIDAQARAESKAADMRANFTLYSRPITTEGAPSVKLCAVVGSGAHGMLNFLSTPNSNPQVLLEGDKDSVMDVWKKALQGVEAINDADLPFVGYGILQPGQSCNTVTRALIDFMGLNDDFASPHVRAGYGRDISSIFSQVGEAQTSVVALTKQAMKDVQAYMGEAHDRFTRKAVIQEKRGILL